MDILALSDLKFSCQRQMNTKSRKFCGNIYEVSAIQQSLWEVNLSSVTLKEVLEEWSAMHSPQTLLTPWVQQWCGIHFNSI